ncbi:RxLR effector protein [Phytophthora megakarya]|uniref:RxLR effector protein n=1 Tax=Phytophthora megakarya TaxID=4795 RepID=A0A225V0I2_9STRA|nr:RxLR effector protein [Phytophthora megakarya]
MRLSCFLMTALSTLSVLQVPVTASVGSNAVHTGVMSQGALNLVGASQSVSHQTRVLRGNNIAKDVKEERGFSAAEAKNFVNKLVKTNSFSDLGKVKELTSLNLMLDDTAARMASAFKVADRKNMSPDRLKNELKTFQELDDDFITKAVEWYSDYLKGLGKLHVD